MLKFEDFKTIDLQTTKIMKKYKVIICSDWWSREKVGKKTEDALNRCSLEGWEVDSIKDTFWGYSTMIVFKKTID